MVAARGRLRHADRPAVRRPTPTCSPPTSCVPSLLAATVFFLVNVVLVSDRAGPGQRRTPASLGPRSPPRRDLDDDDAAVRGAGGRAVPAVLPADGTPVPPADRRRPAGGAGRGREQRPGDARLADRAAEPEPADAARPPDRRDGPRRRADRAAAARPRPLQGDQRHPRPPRRRRAAATGVRAALLGRARGRHRGPARRRRVRRALPRPHRHLERAEDARPSA